MGSSELVRSKARPSPRSAAGKTSRYRGVTLFAANGTYQAFVKIGGVRHHCGMWKDERDAAIARDRAALFLEADTPLNEPRRSRKLGPASPDELRRQARSQAKTSKSSPFFGVHFNTARQRWDAFIVVPGSRKAKWIAQFDTPADAAVAYDRVALAMLGPSALLNHPERELAPATIDEMRRWSRELFGAREATVGRPWRRVASRVGVGRVGAGSTPSVAFVPGLQHARVGGFATQREAKVARERMELADGSASAGVSAEARRLGAAGPARIRRELTAIRKENTTSRYVGVCRSVGRGARWSAWLGSRDREQGLGDWPTERAAAIAVDRARLASGDGEDLNFPRLSRELGPASAASLRREAREIFKRTTSSRFHGVTLHRASGRWVATITVRGDFHHLGYFDDEELAAEAYDDAARRLRSRTARLNFP